jgi:hypothetical protein
VFVGGFEMQYYKQDVIGFVRWATEAFVLVGIAGIETGGYLPSWHCPRVGIFVIASAKIPFSPTSPRVPEYILFFAGVLVIGR